jgi:hypothetical protein
MNKIVAEWSGTYPCLCFGAWTISVGGVPFLIPPNRLSTPMNTYKTYGSWSFDSSWSEIWEDYEDGLGFDSWVQANLVWLEPNLETIKVSTSDMEFLRALYESIKEKDWRYGSCGGCI